MGFKYEVETFFVERRPGTSWEYNYQGQSLIGAVLALMKTRYKNPDRAYRLVVR